jgi:hypothetical protein
VGLVELAHVLAHIDRRQRDTVGSTATVVIEDLQGPRGPTPVAGPIPTPARPRRGTLAAGSAPSGADHARPTPSASASNAAATLVRSRAMRK